MLPGHSDTPQDVKSSQSRIRKSTGQTQQNDTNLRYLGVQD